MDQAEAAANFLFEMRVAKRREAGLPEAMRPTSLAEAYRAQDLHVRKMLARNGGQPIGYKIAATNVAAQKDLDVSAPFFGRLLSSSSHRGPASLPGSNFTTRICEAEFAFEVGADVPSTGGYTADTIRDFIAAVIPSIEVVDHRFHDWKLVGAPTLVADNAIHGAWVEREAVRDWRHIDLPNHAVTMLVNGATARTGSGAAVLGNPLTVVAWLANELPGYGLALRRGDKITTGTTTPVYLAEPGDSVVADFGTLGRAAVAFTTL